MEFIIKKQQILFKIF